MKMETQNENIDALCAALEESKHCVAFTGAGISTLSGIRDFRGKDGIYTTGGADAERMFDIDVFLSDPTVYYRAARDFIYNLDEKEPSIVHTALALLEERGILHAVITQNIDLLHQKAGSKKVIEVHGSPTVHECLSCGFTLGFEEAAKVVRSGGIPECPKCKKPLKPCITFFGEALPARAIHEAEREATQADLLLVLGSSLTVYPAAALPGLTLRHGGRIVIVNNQPTSYDGMAFLHFSDLGSVFAAIKERFA